MVAALVDAHAQRLEPQPVGPARPSARREDLLGFDLEAVVERRHDAAPLDALDALRRLPEEERDPERLHRAAKALGDLHVEERKEPRTTFDERHLHVHRGEHRRVLASDDPSADDEHRLRQAVDLEDRVRVVDVFVVEGNVGGVVRLGAGRDEKHLARDASGRSRADQLDRVRVHEVRDAPEHRTSGGVRGST